MGGKGSNTTTTNQQSTYQPAGAGYINTALNRAQSVANNPFAIPQAPVAGFSQDQQGAFQQFRNAQGAAQPYYNMAANAYSPQGTQDYYNPYAANVMAGMKDLFGQQQSENDQRLTQAAGGVGADRIAVGHAALAKQQDLTAGQTMADLWQRAGAQAQTAGQGFAGLGNQVQNSQLQATNALLASGGLQQQLSQAEMNSPYQQQLAMAAFPYQQAQFLAGITGSLAPGLGGTTYGTGTTTGPAPSMWSQLLGAGVAGVGAYGGAGGFGGSGGGSGTGDGSWYGPSSVGGAPLSGNWTVSARGGRINPYADGGTVQQMPLQPTTQPQQPQPVQQPQQASPWGRMQQAFAPMQQAVQQGFAPMRQMFSPMMQQYGNAMQGLHLPGTMGGGKGSFFGGHNPYFAEGGMVEQGGIPNHDPIDISKGFIPQVQMQPIQAHIPQIDLSPPKQQQQQSGIGGSGISTGDVAKMAMMFANRGGSVNGYADGGAPDYDTWNPDQPYRLAGPAAMDAWRKDTPMAFSGEPSAPSLPPEIKKGASSPYAAEPDRAAVADAAGEAAGALGAQDVSPYSRPSAEAPARRDTGFAGSPWSALMAAGLGMMSGTSPYAGVNIGQGAMQGLKTLQQQREAAQKDETTDQASRRLQQEAKFHEDRYNRLTAGEKQAKEDAQLPYEQLTKAQQEAHDLAVRKQKLEEMKPIQVGQDDMGRPIMMKRNPDTGEYELIKPKKDEEKPGATPSQTSEDDSAIPPNAQPVSGRLPNGLFGTIAPAENVNPEALEGLSPADAKMVRAIAEGRQKFLPQSRNNYRNQELMRRVHDYDSNVDEGAYARRSRTQNAFAAGVQGNNITAMNTFGQHAAELMRISKELNLGQFKDWNEIKNSLAARGYGQKKIQDLLGEWEVASKAVADEGAKVFAGSQSALADREAWEGKFTASNSHAVNVAKLKEVVKLVEGRLDSLQGQYNNGMRTAHKADDFIVPKTRKIFEAIKSGKAPERKQFDAGWGISYDGGKTWEPE